MKPNTSVPEQHPASRAGIRRTVWILAACAIGSYVVFLLSVIGGE
jgi:hypothetical protein